MKMSLRNSGVCILIAIIFSCNTQHTQKKNYVKSLLWKVSGNGLTEPSYLFGTYHLLGEKFLTEVPETQQPFAEAKGIVVELVLDSVKMMSIMMTKAMMFDKKISTLLSPNDFNSVDSALRAVSSYNLKMFDMLKPAQITMMLSLLQTQKLNADLLKKYEGIPLDVHFASAGKKAGKTITALETMEQQFDMLFTHFTVEEQAKQLVENVKQGELTAKASTEMTTLYLQKDLDGLGTLMDAFPKDLTGNMDYMLKDRNVSWVNVLPELMKSGSQFIAVGAGHLPGNDGLIILLREQGYTVTPVTQ